MSDAENTRQRIAETVYATLARIVPEDSYDATDKIIGERAYAEADALIAAFPVLTTEPNETTRPRAVHKVMSLIYKANDEAAVRTPQSIEAFANDVVAAVLAVVPKSTERSRTEIESRIASIIQYGDAGWLPSLEAGNYAVGELRWILGDEDSEPPFEVPGGNA